MKKIGVDISPHQRRRLHNGHPVRVKKGEGIMLVNPANFDTMSKTFLRNKAKQIRLTPEEIKANKLTSPEAHNYNRDEASDVPSVAPQVAPIKSTVSGGRISNAGGTRGIRVNTMAGMKAVSDHLTNLGNHTGRNYGYQLRAGIENALANNANANMIDLGIITGKTNHITGGKISGGSRFGEAKRSLQGGQIGISGTLLASQRVLPQALQSQPYSENWGFANQLPPSYHKFNRSV
jgi:hypothetical protein